MTRQIVGGVLGVLIIGGAVAGSKKTDPDILARVGEVVGQKAKGAVPSGSAVAGPLTAFRVGDRLPVEEQVRVRIHGDKAMDGVQVDVATGSAPGEVRLRGIVRNTDQAQRAVKLAEGTVGVQNVINEIAVPQ